MASNQNQVSGFFLPPGVDNEAAAAYLTESLKSEVTSGLKQLLLQKPDTNAVEELAQFLKARSKKTMSHANTSSKRETTFATEVKSIGTVHFSALPSSMGGSTRSSGLEQPPDPLEGLPLWSVEAPTAVELQAVLDHAAALYPNRKKVHLVVELPTFLEELFFVSGSPYVSDLPKVLEDTRLSRLGDQGGKSSSVVEPLPSLENSVKLLVQQVSRTRRIQSPLEIFNSLKAVGFALNLTVVPRGDATGCQLHDVLGSSIGLNDELAAFVPVILCTFRRSKESNASRILSVLVTLLKPYVELQRFYQLSVEHAANLREAKTFVYHANEAYWKVVNERRDKRDKQREAKDQARKLAMAEAKLNPMAPVDHTAAAGSNQVTPEAEDVSQGANSEHGSVGGGGAGGKVRLSTTQLTPAPPGANAVVDQGAAEARKRAIVARHQRRQHEDGDYLHVMRSTKAQCVSRIAALFRGWRTRAKIRLDDKQQLMECTVMAPPAARQNSNPLGSVSKPKKYDVFQEPPFVGPALVRKAMLRIKDTHGILFTTMPTSKPLPPRKRIFWTPVRSRIAPMYEDDVSSDDEQWSERCVLVPDASEMRRPNFFNPLERLKQSAALAHHDALREAMDIQHQFLGIVPVQRRAYRWISECVLDLFHVAFVELRHRGILRSQQPGGSSFSKFMESFHADVFSWLSQPHFVSLTTSLRGVPLPMQYGALDPLADRLLLSSHSAPQEVPWGVAYGEVDVQSSSEPDPSSLQLRKLSPGVFVAVDVLDKPKWAASVQYLVDDAKKEHITWISTCEHPVVYVSGKPFVASPRIVDQTIEGQVTSFEGMSSAGKPPLQQQQQKTDGASPPSTSTSAAESRNASPPTMSKATSPTSHADDPRLHAPPSNLLTEVPHKLSVHRHFGVSIELCEKRLRGELLRAMQSQKEPSFPYYVTQHAAGGTGMAGVASSSKPTPTLSSDALNAAAASSPNNNASDNEQSKFGSTNGPLIEIDAPMSPIGSPTIPAAPAAYFVELAAAPTLLLKEWSLYPKPAPPPAPKSAHQSFAIAAGDAENGLVGGGASVNMGANSSNHLSQRESGRSMRKKLGSKSNFDTMSQRKSVLSSGGGGGDNQRASFAIEQEVRPDPAQLVNTPHQESASIVAQESFVQRFTMDYERRVVPNAFGEQWLLAMDNFVSRVLSALVVPQGLKDGCVVVAISDPSKLYLAVSASLVAGCIEQARVSVRDGSALSVSAMSSKNETSQTTIMEDRLLDVVSPPRAQTTSPSPNRSPNDTAIPLHTSIHLESEKEHLGVLEFNFAIANRRGSLRPMMRPDRTLLIPEDALQCMEPLYAALKVASPTFLDKAKTRLLDTLRRTGGYHIIVGGMVAAAQRATSEAVSSSAPNNKSETSSQRAVSRRRHVLDACRWAEQYGWLLFLQLFLDEQQTVLHSIVQEHAEQNAPPAAMVHGAHADDDEPMIIEITPADDDRVPTPRSATSHKRNSEEQKAQGESVVATFPSFGVWVNEPRFETALQWLQYKLDPWSHQPAVSPDAHHLCYTAGYRRWAEECFISQGL